MRHGLRICKLIGFSDSHSESASGDGNYWTGETHTDYNLVQLAYADDLHDLLLHTNKYSLSALRMHRRSEAVSGGYHPTQGYGEEIIASCWTHPVSDIKRIPAAEIQVMAANITFHLYSPTAPLCCRRRICSVSFLLGS